MKMKEVSASEAWAKKYPESIVFIVSADKEGKANVMPAGWSMHTSFEPSMVAISIGKTRYTHKLISEGKEFVLAFPADDMEKEVNFCGSKSGRDTDKIKKSGLKTQPAKNVKPPLLPDCVANFECKVVGSIDSGDHTIFVGAIQAAYITEGKKRLYNLGGGKFGSI